MPGSKVGDSLRTKGDTTSRVRRHDPDTQVPVGQFTPTAIKPAPPPAPRRPPRSLGELGSAPVNEVAAVSARHFAARPGVEWSHRRDMTDFLLQLERFPGATWQERWEASGFDEGGRPISDLGGDDARARNRVNAGGGRAFAMRLIRPTLLGFRSNRFYNYPAWFRSVADDPLLEEFCRRVEEMSVSKNSKNTAKFDLCCALTVFGIDLADLTPEALLHYAVECRSHGLADSRPRSGTFAATLAWPVLHDMGVFPASAPRTLRAAVTRGQLTIEEIVDRHQLRNRAVRDLLVDYLQRRCVGIDYSSVRGIASNLVKNFWKIIEDINPGQADLRLSEETFTAWKERLLVLPNGKPRLDVDSPLLAVRSLYLDMQSWAISEPERWSQWVAPCPIRDNDLRWFHLRRRRLQERMANRTRDRQPLLPVLSRHVNDSWQQARALLEAAESVTPGEEFTHDGDTWLKVAHTQNRHQGPVRAVNRTTGELVRVSHRENLAFWQWAVVETLRLAGLRAEELAELTHLSVRQYQRPSGEVVALLVITPSKTDRERVIPMSAELFHVIAQIIRRHRDVHGTVPICARYDLNEKVWSEDMPFLFQTRHSGSQRGMSSTTVWRVIRRACEELAVTRPEFENVKFAPHDFRRLFATELVNNGLPIHIGAALLGHLDIRTTRGYVAVFEEDVITHYQQFLAQRRSVRPAEEYREPTAEEWSDFQDHFDKRRVELGSCGRPYGTPCAHEHACFSELRSSL
ncbi:tyrosine-type recombinase/integrase [Streptomyces sp. NPDC052040]|uniref:tyrosine-type recombinase/integrase n=1 Tax=Streptomyces sp. NPDC052040 TaxID=3365682 RepID=UPI0037D5FF91